MKKNKKLTSKYNQFYSSNKVIRMSFTIFADVNSFDWQQRKMLNSVGFIKDSSTSSGEKREKEKKGLCVCSGISEAFRIKKEGETLTNSDRLFRYGLVISSHSKIKLYDGKNKIKWKSSQIYSLTFDNNLNAATTFRLTWHANEK